MIDSERRESRIRILARGNGVTELGGHPPRFLRVLYEGGKPWPREDFDWNVALQGLIAPAERKRGPGDRRGTLPDKRHPVLTHKTPNLNP